MGAWLHALNMAFFFMMMPQDVKKIHAGQYHQKFMLKRRRSLEREAEWASMVRYSGDPSSGLQVQYICKLNGTACMGSGLGLS